MPTPVASNSKLSADQKPAEETILCAIRPMLVKPSILPHDDPSHNTLRTFIDFIDSNATGKEQRLKASPFRAVGSTFDFSDPAKCHLPNVWQFAVQADLARLYDAVFRSDKQPDFIKAANLQIYIWFPQHGPQPSKKPNFHHLIDIRNFTLYGWCGCLPRDNPKTSRTLVLTTDRVFEDCPHWSKYSATPVEPMPDSHAAASHGPLPAPIGVINGHFPHGVLYPPPEDENSNVVPYHIYGGVHLNHSHRLALPSPGILSNDQAAWPESPIVPREIYLSSSTSQQ
ncbi:hypothetical protein COL154_010869 [Colletotrichum chrysophilum]|uniref:Uncharacterized protein n=1 Tax=Colletotrichum chrysophilum TaxID=1836956 RepID=A0AAD9AE12_9PEZI|nr:uncharacterized protein COL26b_010891 [Colletotrichum chrysophilum]KAJ0344355.1 hypothetical protein KNSL1_009467 [Colletotrichum chrysophilum]KAJ0356712.1 hypothetical protein COL154_010869 [Colletotrichum chrysophilum]KAJ0368472.1 hypothetical protein COL26b_010891 [Colletotrichum chrysophilum]KAK1846428.1 hypothetical protein CCHR01_10916 [Colletotrichum chrysophilum]